MADQIGSDGDGLLLLELGLDVDENEFDKAVSSLDRLKEHLSDVSDTKLFDLGGTLSNLRSIATALKGIVDVWNSLENKALNVAFTTNDYMPYNISPGQRQNLENRLSESKVAAKFGVTSENVLSSLSGIINTQAKVENQGKLNDTDATSLQQLGSLIGDKRLQGSALSGLFKDNPTSYVYEVVTSAIADAYRLAYSKPEGSAARQDILKYIKNVEDTPFVTPEMSKYIAFMTNPNSPDYAKGGNPVLRFFASSQEDEGPYMKNLEKWSSIAASTSESIAVLTAELKEGGDALSTLLFNFAGKNLVVPLLDETSDLTNFLTGKRRRKSYTPEHASAFGNWLEEITDWGHGNVTRYLTNVGSLTSRFGLDANWVVKDDMQKRLYGYLSGSNAVMEDPYTTFNERVLSSELAYYELMKLSDLEYEDMAQNTMQWAIEKIRSTHSDEFSFGRKAKYKNLGEAYSAIAESMYDPKSRYYIGDTQGFSSIYAMMYETGSFSSKASENEKAFLDIMAKAFENTKMSELSKFFGFSSGTDITKAEVVNVGTKKNPDFRLRVTIEDKKTNTETEGTYTSDELVQGIKATF